MGARRRRVPRVGTPGVGAPARTSYLGKQANLQEREAGPTDPLSRPRELCGRRGKEVQAPAVRPRREPREEGSAEPSPSRPASAPGGADPRDSGAAQRWQQEWRGAAGPRRPSAAWRALGQRGAGGRRGGVRAGRKRTVGVGEWAGQARRSPSELGAPLSCKPR